MHISESQTIRSSLEGLKRDIGNARVLMAIGTPDKVEAADRILLAVQHRIRFLLEPGVTITPGDAG